jgi:hypothetical protein
MRNRMLFSDLSKKIAFYKIDSNQCLHTDLRLKKGDVNNYNKQTNGDDMDRD